MLVFVYEVIPTSFVLVLYLSRASSESLSMKSCSIPRASKVFCASLVKNLPTVPLLFKLCDAMGETPDYYLIGKLSADGEDLVELIGRMPGPQQYQARKLVKAFFEL